MKLPMRPNRPASGRRSGYRPLAALCALFLLAGSLTVLFAGCAKKPNAKSEALKSEHFTVNRDAFSFFYTESYYTFYSEHSSDLQYLFDEKKPLDEQKYSDSSAEQILGKSYDGTWQEYFTDEGIDLARQVLRYCEAALAEGMDFIAEDDSAADKLESDLRDRAKSKNQSLDEYIRSLYGSYATLDGMKYASKLTNFAGRYVTLVNARMAQNITDDMVGEYYADHSGTYETSDYYRYTLVTQKTGDKEKDETEIGKMADTANRLKAAKNEEDFVAMIRTELEADAMEAAREEYYDTFRQALSATYSGDELEEEINKRIASIVDSLLSQAINSITETDVTFDDAYRLGDKNFTDWLYSGKAKAGEIRSIVTEDETNYYIVLICLISPPEKDEKDLYRVGLVVFEDTEEGNASALSLADRLSESSSASPEMLKQLGDSLNAKISEVVPTYYDGYYAARYGLQPADAWLASAKTGESGSIRATVSGNVFYVVLYKGEFVGKGWYFSARRDLINSRCNEWYALHADTISVTVNAGVCGIH